MVSVHLLVLENTTFHRQDKTNSIPDRLCCLPPKMNALQSFKKFSKFQPSIAESYPLHTLLYKNPHISKQIMLPYYFSSFLKNS
jgi:hypothetical protein